MHPGRLLAVVVAGAGLLLLAACDSGPNLLGQTDGPRVFVASDVYAQSAGEQAAATRRSELTAAIVALREETGSGWVGRQDDVTGYLGELSGGTFRDGDGQDPAELAETFLDTWGPALFGVDGDAMGFADPTPAARRTVALKGEQQVDGVPVVDGSLNLTVVERDVAQLSGLRGRTFPGLDEVDTSPRVDAEGAAATAGEAARAVSESASVHGQPDLVVLPQADGGVLAWRVLVLGTTTPGGQAPSVDAYFVNADDGSLAAVRPQSIQHFGGPGEASAGHAHGAVAGAQDAGSPQGQPVAVTGTGPGGRPLQGVGLQRPDGSVALVDTTTPWYQPGSGSGAIATHDGSGIDPRNNAGFPGELVTFPSPQADDADALAVHVMHRYVVDYYQQVFGRTSWDGAGGGLTGIVRYPEECSAFFNGFLRVMAYGLPCSGGHGIIDMDVAAHEVTHGVTSTSSNLLYQGQSGALNESFSDYLGNVIGDNFYGRPTASQGEEGCQGLGEPGELCVPGPGGVLAGRHFDPALTLHDYLYLLEPTFHAGRVLGVWSDNGGVHHNSGIWNSALSTIRTRLANVDGGDQLGSVRARTFDQIVYLTLTQYLTPTSGFVDARVALEEAARAGGAEAVIVDTIRQVMDEKEICAGCVPHTPSGVALATTARQEQQPVVTSDWSAWLEFHEFEGVGRLVVARPDGAPRTLTERAVAFAPAGRNLLVMEVPDFSSSAVRIVLYAPDGTARVLQDGVVAIPTVAGSDDLAVWLSDGLYAVDAAGQVHQGPAELAPGTTGSITALGAGGGSIAYGTEGGQVVVWRIGEAGPGRVVGSVEEAAIMAVDVHGDRVVAISNTSMRRPFGGSVHLFDAATGTATLLSNNAFVWSVSVTDQHAAWAQAVGTLTGGVAETFMVAMGSAMPDADLFLHSFATGTTYHLLEQRGQQGVATLVGRFIGWVDAGGGGNDVYGATLPDGL